MKKNKVLLLSFVLVLVLSACSIMSGTENNQGGVKTYEPEANPEASQISRYEEEPLETQAEAEKVLLNEFAEETYDFANPLIKLDPYDAAPLSALILFETEEPVSIEVIVGAGKYEETITKIFEKENTKHNIPVLGLYPDHDNEVILRATNKKGDTRETTLEITTEPLPNDFMVNILKTTHPDGMEEGLTFVVPNDGKVYAIDSNADVRWYSSIDTRIVFNRLSNGNYLQTAYVEKDEANSLLMERDFLGKLYRAYRIDIEGYERNNLIHHDVIEMASGNLLATTHEPDSEYIEDHMHEIDYETGETTQEINVRDVFPETSYTEYDGKNADQNDWLHQNAIWPDDDGRSILISGRSQDAILKLDYPQGDLQWILAMDEDWPEEYSQYLLAPVGEVDFPAGQHAVKVVDTPELADQEELKDVILYDNNAVIVRGNEEMSGQYSQAIRYRINEEEMSVEQIWDYGKERGEAFHSNIVGNVQYLYEQDNIILNSGAIKDEKYGTDRYGTIVEVDALDNDSGEIFEVDVYGRGEQASRFVYRAYRYSLYPDEWEYTLFETNEED